MAQTDLEGSRGTLLALAYRLEKAMRQAMGSIPESSLSVN
jgi:hypothetical protein